MLRGISQLKLSFGADVSSLLHSKLLPKKVVNTYKYFQLTDTMTSAFLSRLTDRRFGRHSTIRIFSNLWKIKNSASS